MTDPTELGVPEDGETGHDRRRRRRCRRDRAASGVVEAGSRLRSPGHRNRQCIPRGKVRSARARVATVIDGRSTVATVRPPSPEDLTVGESAEISDPQSSPEMASGLLDEHSHHVIQLSRAAVRAIRVVRMASENRNLFKEK